MEASDAVLKLIVKECCRPLSYNDEERQFSFPLGPALDRIWERDKAKIRSISPDFVLGDFNSVLWVLENAADSYEVYPIASMEDKGIVNGEVLRMYIGEKDRPVKLIKMRAGQYLDISAGTGLAVGDRFEFCVGKDVVSSDGHSHGVCKSLSILVPSVYNVVLSRRFLKKYYLNNIADSLWPIFDEAAEFLQSLDNSRLENIVKLAADSGVGSFPLLNILKGVCAKKN